MLNSYDKERILPSLPEQRFLKSGDRRKTRPFNRVPLSQVLNGVQSDMRTELADQKSRLSADEFSSPLSSSVLYVPSFTCDAENAYAVVMNDIFLCANVNVSHVSDVHEAEGIKQAASTAYRSLPVTEYSLDGLITHGKIALRDENNFFRGSAIARTYHRLLRSYNRQWLALGCEVITKKSFHSTLNPSEDELYAFIDRYLLAHPEDLTRRLKPAKYALVKVLMLIILLDVAKRAQLMPSCLFCNEAHYKSSAELVRELALFAMVGEGDLLKRLMQAGYTVDYVQHPLDELNFLIKNTATDLRDGVRLARLLDCLEESDQHLLCQMKYPTLSRAQRLVNVDSLLQVLWEGGIELSFNEKLIEAHHIVDGHRQSTLLLLWKIFINWRLPRLAIAEHLHEEIESIGFPDTEAEADIVFEDECVALLFRWARSIAALRGLQVLDLTTSFANGKVLTYIVEYYRQWLGPSILSRGESAVAILRSIGYDSFFTPLFNPSTHTTPCQDVIVIALAFLASQLLSQAREERYRRKIVSIQRCFREHLLQQVDVLIKSVILNQACIRGILLRNGIVRTIPAKPQESSFQFSITTSDADFINETL